ncbi:GFA family protein [Paractinoplanes toevensis]|uniref:CENP-V/GFA domain-containing protein n=1 Tax=Paractinoplanes toevensis TaxID=571911 RepID=A0A919T5D6_9ACTN|nr:GFA family protein [Actinoplanes toevensis]GIM88677.1 hypothetical protein Ato02nite_004700 [Actinoplanes toevensis]
MATRKSSCNCGKLNLTYDGPDPERVSICQCNECQKRTGSVFSVQSRLPAEHVTIEGRSATWSFPVEGAPPASFRSCDSEGATYHFCPECGSTVYWELGIAPGFVGVAVGNFTDPTFPPPVISGFEAYGPAWALNASTLPIPHHDYDGTSHGGPRL